MTSDLFRLCCHERTALLCHSSQSSQSEVFIWVEISQNVKRHSFESHPVEKVINHCACSAIHTFTFSFFFLLFFSLFVFLFSRYIVWWLCCNDGMIWYDRYNKAHKTRWVAQTINYFDAQSKFIFFSHPVVHCRTTYNLCVAIIFCLRFVTQSVSHICFSLFLMVEGWVLCGRIRARV